MLNKKNKFIYCITDFFKRSFQVLIISTTFIAFMFLFIPDTSFARDKPETLRLVVSTPPNDYPLGYSLNEMAKKFNKRAKGEYIMEIHAGGALAKLPEYFDAVRIGAVEMASAGWTIFSFLDPKLGAIEVPYLFNNNEAANYEVKYILPLYDQILQEKFNAKGIGFLLSWRLN